MKMRKAYSYIRFSTLPQRLGSSEERQIRRTMALAATKGWELTHLVPDRGISAFRGDNAKKGSLRVFLDAVDDGVVAPGSVLIVESLDRLSRQNPWNSLGLVTEIITKGIGIYDLEGGLEYCADMAVDNPGQLFLLIGHLQRAHSESQMKSTRGRANWKIKRDKASTTKLTRSCPAWLEFDSAAGEFVPIPERADLVRQIFSWSADGLGSFAIRSKINAAGVRPWKRGKAWHQSYVKKILSNRAVLGEYQPHVVSHDTGHVRRTAATMAPLLNYYPPIVDSILFSRAQQGKAARTALSARGAKGETYSNLFSGLIRCHGCGAPVWFINKGVAHRGGTYLQCSLSARKGNCDGRSWRYGLIEPYLLREISGLDLGVLLGVEAHNARTRIEAEIRVLRTFIDEQLVYQKKLLLLLESVETPTIIERMNQSRSEHTHAVEQVHMLEDQLKALDEPEAVEAQQDMTSLFQKMAELEADGDTDGLFELRRRLAQALKRLVLRIELVEGQVFRPEDIEGSDPSSIVGAPDDILEAVAQEASPLLPRHWEILSRSGVTNLAQAEVFFASPSSRERFRLESRMIRIAYRFSEVLSKHHSPQPKQAAVRVDRYQLLYPFSPQV